MKSFAGYVLDVNDDLDGRIFKSFWESRDAIPEFVKTATKLSSDQVERLPDDQFALILLDSGYKFKKYATVDKGNTLLSLGYFLKQSHLLPPEAVKIAASNLIDACLNYQISIPYELQKAAETGSVTGKAQNAFHPKAKVIKSNFPMKETEKETTDNPHLGDNDAATEDVDQRTNLNSVQGNNFLKIDPFPQKEHTKEASVEYLTRQQTWRVTPYVDVSDWTPEEPKAEPPKTEQTLLAGQYPVDSYDQAKTAVAYFSDNWVDFHPRDRHEYCVKLGSRIQQLDIPGTEKIARYSSEEYAADVDIHVEARKFYIAEEYQPALKTLLEKRSHVSPDTFAEVLADFDYMTGLNFHWDGKISDPWYSTFGPSHEKLADEMWRWDHGGVRISVADLEDLAKNGKHSVCAQFGQHFHEEFSKSPKAVFESLPEPNKIILARMATDRNSGAGSL